MKKLSFFLMAMLFSVMSFAAEATATISFANKAQRTEYSTSKQVWEQNGIVVTNEKASSTSNVGDYSNPARFYKSSKVTIKCNLGNITKIEISGCGENKYATPWNTNSDAQVSGTNATITPKSSSDTYTIATLNGQARAGQMVITYEVSEEDFVATPVVEGEQYFKESTTVSMRAAEGLDIYYTVDGTEPTKASTPYTASFELTATTTVKAVAYDGENASEVVTVTFTKMQVLTPSEAVALCTTTESTDKYIIRGYVTEIATAYDASYNNITIWLGDKLSGENLLQAYRAVPTTATDKEVVVGNYVEVIGKLILFGSSKTPEVPAGGTYTIIEAPAVEEPTIDCKDALDFGATAYNNAVAAQTLEVTGYNLTTDITVTLSEGAVFTVDQTTLPAAGGNLVVTPVSPLTVGTHTATLTLTSGEATAEVALTIVAKDVYTITWSVNGETSTTSVVEGDKLVLPTAPEAPEACSEKVFVGWTAAEEVNADGSDIEWVTATTVPTDDATYYAVFALASGEGGVNEVVDVLDRALTGVEGTNYASWADVSATSDAVYAGQSAGGNEAIQLRSNNSNSGVISTTSGGKLAKVTVAWNSNTAAGRTLNVYGSNSAYTAPTDLYGDASGEKLGTIVSGTSTELVIEGDYAYVGLRSASGAMYLDEIQITWTSGAAVTYTDYSTTCESEPVIEWMEMDLEITNLVTEVMEVGDKKYLQLAGRDDMNDADVTLFLNNYADVDDDYEVNAESSYMTFGGMELTVIEGVMTQTSETDKGTIYTGTVYASVTDEEEGGTMYVKFALTMYAAPATVLELTDAIVAINEELGTLTFNVPTGEGEGYFVELSGYTAPGVHEGPQICLLETPEAVAFANYVETSVVDGVITLTGEFTSFMGAKFDLTISGKLPVVEPTTITYELNGGEFPAVVVPTNAELWEAFKPYYNTYYGLNRADQAIDKVSTFASAYMQKIMTDEASEYKWLGDYVLSVATAAGVPLSTDMAAANESGWRWAVHAFFNAAAGQYGAAGIDFTEAGKPEVWGAAYEAEYGVVLPTEPVDAPYTLPTPVKEGYTFVGWYDNAEGTGEAYTVIPAGWAGTLYAIWKQSPATALENIAVEGKAVKAIVNGQLIIIKNGVQYNAQGQVVK